MTVTEKQIAALRYLVARARLDPMKPQVSRFVRQLVWLLIEASEGLTKGVFVTMHEGSNHFTRSEIEQIAHAAGSLNSENSSTYLCALLALMGTEFRFMLLYGAFDSEGQYNTDGQFPNRDGHHDAPMRFTFWFAPGAVLNIPVGCLEVHTTREELEAIDTTQDGLYS